jgi:tetratricopeptide (TPR) repeat protein
MAVSRERVVQNAEKYVSRGKVDAAIKEYRKLLAENPNDISTLNRVGDLYARINRNSEAIDLFTQIAEQYAEDGFFVKAIAIYKKIIKIDPTLLEIYEQLADLYHRQGLVNEARTQYQVLADYYLKHDRSAQAISIYRRMAELEPEDPSHHVRLAELYQQEGETGRAMGEYRAIADLMLGHGKGIEAARVYERALDVDSEDLGFITDAVLKLKEGGHVAAAANFLALAVDRNPQAVRVAKIAGLERQEAPPPEEPEAAPEVPAGPEIELELDEAEAAGPAEAEASWDEVSGARPEAEAAGEDDAPAEEVADDGRPADFDFEDLEPQVFEFDLDDDTSASQVTPPADMMEDEGRRGAAWSDEGTGAPAPVETAPPEAAAGAAEADEAPAEEVAAAEPVETTTGTFELDLGALEAEEDDTFQAEASPELDHDLLERTAAEVHGADEEDEVEDLLTEAEVLARYGIEEKALERLAELLHREPHNLKGYDLMVSIHLDAGRHERVVAVAGRMAEIAAELGDEVVWPDLRMRMVDSGYSVHEDGAIRIDPPAGLEEIPADLDEVRVVDGSAVEPAAGAPAAIAEEDLDLDLDGDLLAAAESGEGEAPEAVAFEAAAGDAPAEEPLVADEPPPVEEPPAADEAPPVEEPEPEPPAEEPPVEPPPPVEEPPARKRRDVDSILAQLSGQFGRRKKRSAEAVPEVSEPAEIAASVPVEEALPEPPAAPPPAAGSPVDPVDPLRALGDSLRAEIDDGSGAVPPAAAASGASVDASLEDTGTSWLDEVAATPAAGDGDAFTDDADFFDLGAELEQELSAEDGGDEDLVMLDSGEQSLEEIVEGFKKGVAENLSPEDFDTHFNLGIAYREMGLLDEAIGEFQLAAREPAYLVSCASMLGLCFNEKGLPELAVKWYRRGLDAPGISDDDRAGLLYDLGEALVAAGDRMAAYHTFVDLYGINTNYRDVVARLAELEPAH